MNFNKKNIYVSLICCLAFSFCNAADPRNIVEEGEAQLRGKSAQFLMTMKIVRESFSRELKMRTWSIGSEKSLVEILEPKKEEGVISLRAKDQMWNFLPKTDQVIRVPTSLMLQSWMGSDFTNDDLMKLSSLATDYTHKILKEEKLKGENTWKIECTPKPEAPVVWGKIHYWARKLDKLPVLQEYYDEKNKLIRTLALSSFKKMDDRIIPTVLTISKADSTGEKTTVTYEKVLFNKAVPETLFEKESLKKTSQNGKNITFGWATGSLESSL